MSTPNKDSEVARLQRTTSRHISRVAEARRILNARRSELVGLAAALEETLDEITMPHQRYRIRRWLELALLLMLTIAEIVVAETVVQALTLSPISTDLVAVAVGAAATGLAWLIGQGWAVAYDPQAVAVGRRGWLGIAAVIAVAFLAANLAVRVYYGLLAERANQLGSGLMAPLLAGSLLTATTTALMAVAAFVTAHAETGKQAELRTRLQRVRNELRILHHRAGPVDAGSDSSGHLSVVDEDE